MTYKAATLVEIKSTTAVNMSSIRVAPDLMFFSNPAGAGAPAGPDLADNPSVIAVSLCELGSKFVISHC